jgi:group I intron endonuclease
MKCCASAMLETSRCVDQSWFGGSIMTHDTTRGLFCVYKISNSINNKVYIGITVKGLQRRWNQHVHDSRRHPRLAVHRAMAKYDIESFIIEVQEICPDVETMQQRELYWISFYNSVLPNGYNSTSGGEWQDKRSFSDEHRRKLQENGRRGMTPEMRKRLGAMAKERWADPEYRDYMIQLAHKRTLSEQQKANLREKNTGLKQSPETVEKRMQKVRGRKHTDVSREHMSQAQKKKLYSPEMKESLSARFGRLTPEQAAIVKFDVYRQTEKAYGAMFGISQAAIHNIVAGITYRHITHNHLPLSLYKQQSLWEQPKVSRKQIGRSVSGRFTAFYEEAQS